MNKKLIMILSAALLLILVMMLPALASAKTWSNCTVDVTEVAPGDVIGEHVKITNQLSANVDNIQVTTDGKLDLCYHGSDPIWSDFYEITGQDLLELFNQYIEPDLTSLTVASNSLYIAPCIKFLPSNDNVTRHLPDSQPTDLGHCPTPEDPEDIGFVFGGWYKEKECINVYDFETEIVDRVITVYFKMTPNSYKIVFDANGGSGSMADETFEYGEAKHLSNNAFTMTGYHFIGWNTDPDASEGLYSDSARVENLTAEDGQSIKLFAIWTENTYTVVFDANGGSGSMEPEGFCWGETQQLWDNAFTRTGYTFLGWNADKTATTAQYSDGEGILNLTDDHDDIITLYAIWAGYNYTVAFDANGGSGSMADEAFVYGQEQALTANAFTKTGYSFLGWNTDKTATTARYADGETVSNLTDEKDGAVTLYAIWSLNGYTVTFDANGGSGSMADESFVYGQEQALTANTFTRTGYTFLGWNTDKTTTTARYADGEKVSNLTDEKDGAVTLYAIWAGYNYTVAFDANGGSGSMADESFVYGQEQALTANAFTKTGFTFLGWNTDKAATTAQYADGEKVSNLTDEKDGAVTLYAIWSGNGYTVAFDANGGSGSMANESFARDEEKALTANAFTKTGFTFLGWNTDKAATAAQYADGEKVSNLTDEKDGAVTLYAIWSGNGYTVTFDANGGSGSMANESFARDEEKALTANTFTKLGYTFLGWNTDKAATAARYADGETVSNLTDEKDGAVTLYAIWSANSYTVIFDANDGKGSMPNQSFIYNQVQALTANAFKRTGYTFLGWSTDGSNIRFKDGEKVLGLTPVKDGVVRLYAMWEGDGLTLDPSDLTLPTNKVLSIKAQYSNGDSYKGRLTWTADEGLDITGSGSTVSVSSATPGTYTVTATTEKGLKATATVTVKTNTYIITKGKQQTFPQNAEVAEFASNAEYSKFVRLEVDGKILARNQYQVKAGSTIVTLFKEFISTLPTGTHTLSIISTDGRADTTFTVYAAPPRTGDSTPILPWLGLLVLGLCGILRVNVRRGKGTAR